MLHQEVYGAMPSLRRLTVIAVRPRGQLLLDEFLDVGLLERCQRDIPVNQERLKRLAVNYVLMCCARLISAVPKKLFKIAPIGANNRSCNFHPLPPFSVHPDGEGRIRTLIMWSSSTPIRAAGTS
jgi:hypothetical protein